MCRKSNEISPTTENAKPAPSLQDIYDRELVSKRHNCTDIICLILFIVFIFVQVIMSLVVFIKGGSPASKFKLNFNLLLKNNYFF
jgi:hypothetical protein